MLIKIYSHILLFATACLRCICYSFYRAPLHLVKKKLQESWDTTGRMSYDQLTTDWNNGDHVNGGHGVLDTSTGIFTAGNLSNSHGL